MSSRSPFGHRAEPQASGSPGDGAASASPSGADASERRRYARIPLALRGRYMLEGGREYPCVTRDVSRLGVAIEGVPVGALGERVIAYLEELGRIEGKIIRRSDDWFAIELVATPLKLERLDEKISAILRRTMRGGEAAE